MPDSNPFDSRSIDLVLFEHFTPSLSSQKEMGIGATVVVSVTSEDGKSGGLGPSVRVQLFVPAEDKASLQDVRLAVLERTLQLLQRIGRESADSLNAQWEKTSQEMDEKAQNVIVLP